MHPIEHLRYVARAHGADPVEVALGAADALIGVSRDPGATLVSARRLVEHHPSNGPLWSVCATAVTSFDPGRDTDEVARSIADDPVAGHLADALDDAETVLMVGWSGHVVDALVRRGHVHVLVVDSLGDGQDALRHLSRREVSCELVAPEGTASAAESADATVLAAMAAGDQASLCAGGSLAVAAVAYCAHKPVWMVAAAGTRLPAALFDPMVDGLRGRPDPWASGVDVVPHDLVAESFTPAGRSSGVAGLRTMVLCPPAEELLRRSVV